MRQYKKRTIALCLATALTVIGAFGAENYQNSLMSLRFDTLGNGNINAVLYTKNQYTMPVSPQRQDKNTYIIILKNTNSECKITDLSPQGDILSVEVSTTPYTSESEGYTKIEIKTTPNTFLRASTALYLPNAKSDYNGSKTNSLNESNGNILPSSAKNTSVKEKSYWEDDIQTTQKDTATALSGNDTKNIVNNSGTVATKSQAQSAASDTKIDNSLTKEFKSSSKKYNYNNAEGFGNNERIIIAVAIVLIGILIMFFFFMSKEKMATLLGEKSDYNFDDDDDNSKKSSKKAPDKHKKSKMIRSTIHKLDNEYPGNASTLSQNIQDTDFMSGTDINPEKTNITDEEENNVLDLDALFKEKTQQNNDEKENNMSEQSTKNKEDDDEDDLAAFLDEFTTDTEEEKEPEKLYDEEFFDNLMNMDIDFTSSDVSKIDQLIQIEVSTEMMDLREEYLNEKNKKSVPAQNKIIEELIASYTIKQNITFTREDVEALQKLMNVELDESFINDLRTNPERVKEVQKELENKEEKPHNTSDILTLNVHDLLPDLSKELNKHKENYMESDAKSDIVYYSEGYNVAKFSVDSSLFDFSKEMNDKRNYEFQPSYETPIVETGYEYSTLDTGNSLPDLQDVLANPKKYEEKPKDNVVADENDLLARISNVTFKPFYEENDDENEYEPLPTVSDIKAEMTEFEGFEIVEESSELYENLNQTDSKQFNEFDSSAITTENNTEQNKSENAEHPVVASEETQSSEEIDNNNTEKFNERTSQADNKQFDEQKNEVITVKSKNTELKNLRNTETLRPDGIELVKLDRQKSVLDYDSNLRKRNCEAEKLLKLIEEKQQIKKTAGNEKQTNEELEEDFISDLSNNRKSVQQPEKQQKEINGNEQTQEGAPTKKIPEHPQVCVYEGNSYKVLNIAQCNEYSGCYLAQSQNEYAVFGYVGDKITKIKSYAELKSENIKMRFNENLSGGIIQYLVKVSTHKFVLNVTGNNMKWVMDLC